MDDKPSEFKFSGSESVVSLRRDDVLDHYILDLAHTHYRAGSGEPCSIHGSECEVFPADKARPE